MPTIAEIRKQYPQYADLSTDELLRGLHAKFYSDIPLGEFVSRLYRSEKTSDPTADMSWVGKFVAGAGKAIVDTGRGIGQLVGAVDQKDIDEAKRLDEPLMRTGGGITGNIAGNLAMMIGPAAALGAVGKAAQIPMAVNAARGFMLPRTIPGAAGVGAAMGAIQPVASDDSRLQNIALGGVGGAAVPTAVAGGRVVKSLLSPFSEGGRQTLVGQTLGRYAHDPRNLLNQADQLVPGSLPTTAESAQDPGISQLYRTMVNNPDVNAALAARQAGNTAARVEALRDIAGDAGKREFYTGMRDQAAEQNYGMAFAQLMHDTPWIKGQIAQLEKRPAFIKALEEAKDIAANQGIKIDPENATQVLHFTKMALDDQISTAVRAGNGNAARGAISTRDKLVALMETDRFSPAYREARKTHAEMSRPINQMEIGQALLDKLQPALAEYGASNRTRAQAYAQAVRDADATAKRALGFSGAKMEDVMSPQQMETITNIAKDLGRAANAQEAGKAIGSPTAQNLVSQDILRQTLGPLGLPKSWAESTLAETMLRPVSFAYKIPEKRLSGLLGEAMLDPKLARRLYERGLLSAKPSALDSLLPYTSQLGIAGLLGLSQ